ncbi:B12-binding domain-containing radical SAM protein [Streptomyces sp. NPDC090029]|uniref:B12-binding domain-containing radical SAM protein n=1 Tax=Streptomyces sp. NPDC090029 TaxID=3365924 RepID=UPI0038126A3D
MAEHATEKDNSIIGNLRIHPVAAHGADELHSFDEMLLSRRNRLAELLSAGGELDRYFPVLSVLAPVMTQSEGEITYPGDPMCLYGALSVAVHRSVTDAGPLDAAQHYNDLSPQWTRFPSKEYRLTAVSDGYRPYTGTPNTDQTVFDPRIWDEQARVRWIRLLRQVQPRVVLISAVSPAHRYALEIATLVRTEVPRAFVILGGRHADETIITAGTTITQRSSSPLAVMADGRAPHVIDAVVTGEAYYTLDVLMRALALSMDLIQPWVDTSAVPSLLRYLLAKETPPGRSTILVATGGARTVTGGFSADGGDSGSGNTHEVQRTIHAFPFDGPQVDLAALPSPYEAFAIRSRFPIFTDPATGGIQRTAHFMTSNSCPYQCNFCSESSLLNRLNRFKSDAARRGVERVCEYVNYGAEALFFDDSIFWSGRYADITDFCTELYKISQDGWYSLAEQYRRFLDDEEDIKRLERLQWGAQLTVDTLVSLHSAEESSAVLGLMKQAGCSYVYIGIESMATQVMDGIHKNLRRKADRPWGQKVREAVSLVKSHGLRVGTSVLFGLDGETRETIDETIEGVGRLIDERLIDLASPNILTYHPATPITRRHDMHDKLDYHSPHVANRKPYTYFEEAFPGVVSVALTEVDIWHIHEETGRRWGSIRNDTSARDESELAW